MPAWGAVHSTQQDLIPTQERDVGGTPCPQVGRGTSSRGCGAGIGAESGHFHLGEPCLPLTLVGAGALGAVPASGPAGRDRWQKPLSLQEGSW